MLVREESAIYIVGVSCYRSPDINPVYICNLNEGLERINSIGDTNGSFFSCKRLGLIHLYELRELKLNLFSLFIFSVLNSRYVLVEQRTCRNVGRRYW